MTIDITTPIEDQAVVENAADNTVDLFNHFDDPRTTGLVARFELYKTSLAGGVSNILLFDQEGDGAPLTVQNFLNYVDDGDYVNSFIHRSIPGFVVQGGGFTLENLQFGTVPSDDSVQNEYSPDRSNLRGTIAMAKTAAGPDTATNQWFFNLADNSENLDNQNGGFTVFGEALTEADIAVADAIAAVPIRNGSSINGAFTDLPVDSEDSTLDNDDELIRYRSITVSQQDELTFTVLSNSNSSVVNAVIANDGQLVLDYLQPGTSQVVIRATNLLGQTIDDTFVVTVEDAPDTTPSEPGAEQPSSSASPNPVPSPGASNSGDEITGGGGDNEINGLGGNDIILGLDGNDQLAGGGGQDRLEGGNGNDTLNGGGGKDNLNGGNGNDALNGGGGKDSLNGGKGNDDLFGGGGNDRLKGGKGKDTLDGGKGNNVLIGGKDRDIFVLTEGKGRSLIRDFKDGQDRLRASGISFKDLTIEQSRKNTLIRLGNDDLALLKGIDAELITRADFVA